MLAADEAKELRRLRAIRTKFGSLCGESRADLESLARRALAARQLFGRPGSVAHALLVIDAGFVVDEREARWPLATIDHLERHGWLSGVSYDADRIKGHRRF